MPDKTQAIIVLSFVIPLLSLLGWAAWLTMRSPDKLIPTVESYCAPRWKADKILYPLYQDRAFWPDGEPDWRWPVWNDYRHGTSTDARIETQQVGPLQAPAARRGAR